MAKGQTSMTYLLGRPGLLGPRAEAVGQSRLRVWLHSASRTRDGMALRGVFPSDVSGFPLKAFPMRR